MSLRGLLGSPASDSGVKEVMSVGVQSTSFRSTAEITAPDYSTGKLDAGCSSLLVLVFQTACPKQAERMSGEMGVLGLVFSTRELGEHSLPQCAGSKGVEPSALSKLSKYSTTEPHLQTPINFILPK